MSENIDMLQLIDTALAFAAIMLLLSLLVTVVVQAAVSLFGLRGRNLLWAVTELLQRVSPDLAVAVVKREGAMVDAVAKARVKAKELLSDPVLGPTRNWLRRTLRPPTEMTVKDLAHLLEHHKVNVGVPDAARTIGPQAVDAIEKQISGWFDLVMRAAGERFKLRTRWITVLGAFVLAFALQVDSLQILNDLSDTRIRGQAIEQIDDINRFYEAAVSRPEDDGTAERARATMDSVLTMIDRTEIVEFRPIRLSQLGGDLVNGFWGKVMTLLLLSLGAPFWYGAIGKLVGFRSALKPKENEEAAKA